MIVRAKEKYIREAGKIVANSIEKMALLAVPGNTTGHLNNYAKEVINSNKHVKSSFYGFSGFPEYICTSINEEAVHGIPSCSRELKEGDMLSIDFAVSYKGYHADAAITIPIGKVDNRKTNIISVGKATLNTAISVATKGRHIGDISYTIQSFADDMGCIPVIEFSGHCIGTEMHMPPQIPSFGIPESGLILEEGMALAIEPVIADGKYKLQKDMDGWTVRTTNGVLTSHFEHTVLITKNGTDILTKV